MNRRPWHRRIFRRKFRWPLVRRRFGVLLTLCAYLAATTGLPLPAGTRKDTSQPYPCQNHPCGCLCAEDCWRHCCCLSVEERWAWARAHNVEPPAYAERPAGIGWQTTPLRVQTEGREVPACPSCCQANDAPPGPCCAGSLPTERVASNHPRRPNP